MRRRLYLMRHAEVSYLGAEDPSQVGLTDRGRTQADAARRALEDVRLDLVLTSTMPRTVETAAVVAPGTAAEAWPDMAEWRSGQLSDLPADDLETAIVRALLVKTENDRFLAGESLGEALDRVHGALRRLLAREWATALAVLHGGVNRLVLSYALTGGERTYYGNFEQAPACINVLDLDEAEWIVRTVNFVPYDPLAPARTTTMEEQWRELEGWLRTGRPR